MPSTDPIPSVTADQLTRALGEAVIRIWSNLPQDVQLHLFQEAVTSQGESIRAQLAVFLRDKDPRTSDPLASARERRGADSLGGWRVSPRGESRYMQGRLHRGPPRYIHGRAVAPRDQDPPALTPVDQRQDYPSHK